MVKTVNTQASSGYWWAASAAIFWARSGLTLQDGSLMGGPRASAAAARAVVGVVREHVSLRGRRQLLESTPGSLSPAPHSDQRLGLVLHVLDRRVDSETGRWRVSPSVIAAFSIRRAS